MTQVPGIPHVALDSCGGDTLSWLHTFMTELENSSMPLAKYFRSTFYVPEGASEPKGKPNEVFPCPPPFPWVVSKPGHLGKSRRRCARWRVRRACELWVNLAVCALSHEALALDVAPLRGRRGFPLNPAQSRMCSFLGTLVKSVVRLGQKDPGCGLRLPATNNRLSSLRSQLVQFGDLPYGCQRTTFESRDGSFTATQALPLVADRLSLPEEVQDFDPLPFLSPMFQQIYENPDAFLKPEHERPDPIRVRGTATRPELLKVMARWDKLGRLFVCRGSEVSREDRCELFAVAKDEVRDRQILHRKRRNLRELHVVGASRDLPHGVLLCQLPLEGRRVCVCSVDDVRDFYHAYKASDARAKSSPVGPLFRSGEVAHLKAYQDAVAQGRVRPGENVACCFKGLGMGDHAAVDIAQESHVNLLKSYGAMKDSEVLKYRNPVPNSASGFVEGVMIDDHLGIQMLDRLGTLKDTLAQPGRDQTVFAASLQAYEHNGLQAHPKKQLRRSLHAKVWGAEIEGDKGLVGPSRGRLLRLARLSSGMAQSGAVDQRILEGVLGLWGFCAQFRRPMYSFLFEVYRQASPGGTETPFRLTTGARNEFGVMACLAPLCLNDLNVLPDPNLFCVDASPSGAGVCRARVGYGVSREVWRRGDKQGYRAPLLSKVSASLKGSGWDEEVVEDLLAESEPEAGIQGGESAAFEVQPQSPASFAEGYLNTCAWHGWRPAVPSQLGEGAFDFLEVYSGCARMTAAWAKEGFRVLPPLELKQGYDLTEQRLFWGVLGMLRCRRVKFVWLVPPCTTFSLARSPKLRNLLQPWGFQLLDKATMLGNLHAAQCLLLAWVQLELGLSFGLEQPAFGFMRGLGPWSSLVHSGAFQVIFDWCQYGRNFLKPTRVLTNFVVLKGLERRCRHRRKHVSLKGQATTAAGAYSPSFCRKVAQLCRVVWESGDWESLLSSSVSVARDLHSEQFDCCKGRNDSAVWEERRRKAHRKRSSTLWAVQLSEGLAWKTIMQYRFRTVTHINIQEAKARRSLVKRLPESRRVVVCQDSRVNLGALGKGRSPSEALNAVMRTEAPYLLGKNLYLAGVHLPTWSIRADAPSRSAPVLGPRTPLPPWFWHLTRGDPEGHAALDDLQGWPRALNRWFLLGGAMLLRGASEGSTSQSCSASSQGAVGAGTGHSKDPFNSGEASPGLGSLAPSASAGVYCGDASPELHRRSVRMVRRIYDFHVSSEQKQKGCSGNVECLGTKVWMAEILACRALGLGADMGRLGTCPTPSTHFSTNTACTCGYCAAVAMAPAGGSIGVGLFWLAETFRAYLSSQAGYFTSQRPLGRRRRLHSSGSSENPQSGGQLPTRPSGRARRFQVGQLDDPFYSDVASHLEWLVECLQTPL